MKTIAKTTYLLLGGLILLSSCRQEETPVDIPDTADRKIVFHASVPELTTRAAEITTDLPYFRLTAFDETDDKLIEEGKLKEYVGDLQIEKSAGLVKVTSDDCVWPVPGQESDLLHFFAYYPELELGAKLNNSTSAGYGVRTIRYKVDDFQVAPDIADQIDFVTAYANGSMADNLFSGISLNFRHQLSRIEVKVKGAHKSCDIEIVGVRIANVPMHGNFEFQKSDADGSWTDISLGDTEYIFREGDAIVTVGTEPVSILGRKIEGGYDNCAMLIPSAYPAWDYEKDALNGQKGMYLNVLLRIIDKTPTAGKGKVQYPYFDNSQGLNAMDIPREYFAVVKATNTVSRRLYKKGDTYFTDSDFTIKYMLASGEEIREFGWAALPISADWQPGYTYAYTLDYTVGIGVHGPDVKGDTAPKAGDPIISDKIGVSVSVNGWQRLNDTTTPTVEVPGS